MFLTFAILANVVLCKSVGKLNFKCPNVLTPEEALPVCAAGGGYPPVVDLVQSTNSDLSQFKAAKSLAPCNTSLVRVFTTKNFVNDPNMNSLGVIFIEPDSVQKLSEWFR